MSTNYIVVVDAGAAGSTAHLYAYDPARPLAIRQQREWHMTVKPSIEAAILEYGMHDRYIHEYLDHLLAKLYHIVPIEHHFRTPLFFHATNGLRALDPSLQSKILLKICTYLQKNIDFYVPDCQTHVNILDGDIEGVYTWITLNYLMNQTLPFTNDDDHSYGLLQLSGRSSQICFQPKRETINAQNSMQLFTLDLQSSKHSLYSTSFLGFGLNQAHHDYLLNLIETLEPSTDRIINDPCSPLNHQISMTYNNKVYQIIGSSDFNQCRDNIYRLIIANAKTCSPLLENSDDEDDDHPFKVSNCVLNPHIPKFNLTRDHFIAISSYWETITDLLKFTNQFPNLESITYDPSKFVKATMDVCNASLESLTSSEHQNHHFTIQELSSLCFKSTYVSSLLHSSLGLPLSLETDPETQPSQLLLSDVIDNVQSTWTLGKALLYAIDESARLENPNAKIGYSRNSSPNLFIHGSEQEGIPLRPEFVQFSQYTTRTFHFESVSNPTSSVKANTPDTFVDYYDDFDTGKSDYFGDSTDNEYQLPANDVDSDGISNTGSESDLESDSEFVYKPHNTFGELIIKIVTSLFVILSLLLVLPFTRRWLIRLLGFVKASLASSSSSSSSSTPVHLRKFNFQNHIELQNFQTEADDDGDDDLDDWDNDSDGIERAAAPATA